MTHKNLGGTKVTVEQILSDYDAIHEYNSWYENKQIKNIESFHTKSTKSVVITMPIENEYIEKSLGSGKEKSSFLNPIVNDVLEADENMVTHDFDSFLTMKKSKSFKVSSINDDFKGKKKRFSVMKIIPEEIREKARSRADDVLSSVFLEHDKKVGESIFQIPEGLHHEAIEMSIEYEIINLMYYVFTLANCRT
jgi:hypothetical protein